MKYQPLIQMHDSCDIDYNLQTTVDAKHKLIADFKVKLKSNDLGELDNMALRAKNTQDIFCYGKF